MVPSKNSDTPKREDMMSRLDALLERKTAPRSTDLPPPAERARLRKAIGLSQAEVAELLETNRPNISAWERGQWEPSGDMHGAYLDLLQQISDRLNARGAEVSTDDQD